MIKSDGKKVTNAELFALVFVSRFTALIIAERISFLSLVFEMLFSFIMLISAHFLSKKFDFSSRGFRLFAGALCLVLAALTFYSVIDFKESAISLKMPSILIFFIILLSALYCAYLGLYGLVRFAPVCFSIVFISAVIGVLSVVKTVDFSSISGEVFKGISVFNLLKCVDVFALYLLIADESEQGRIKPFSLSVLASYLFAFAVYFVCASVVGNAQKYYPYPLFTMFQLGSIGSYNKLDILFTSPFLTGAFLKLCVFLYGAGRAVK